MPFVLSILSVYASTSHFETSPALRLHATYRLAATLDTGPVANSYPGGVHTRLSSTHFLSARSPLCSHSTHQAETGFAPHHQRRKYRDSAAMVVVAETEETHRAEPPNC